MRENQTQSEGQTLLPEAEIFQLLRMAVEGKPRTREELVAVIEEAQRMRAEACLLDLVLDGQLCMYQANGKIMMCRPDSDRPTESVEALQERLDRIEQEYLAPPDRRY